MKKDILVKNYSTYRDGLERLIGDEITDTLIESLGGDDAVMNATYSNLVDSGSAFDGSFVKNVIKLARIASQINEILPEGMRADAKSIGKVCLLSQIAKVVMLSPNDNNWEVVNRGMVYKYTSLDGALRTGERSIMLAANAGVKFTPEEFEAMGILDRNAEDDNYKKYFSSPLSTVVRQAAELIGLINKAQAKDSKNG
jgi:hypothetical protein